MAFQTNFKIIKLSDKSKIKIVDLSVGDETPTSRIVKLTKTDLSITSYPFVGSNTELTIEGLNKDYALHFELIVTVSTIVTGSIYNKIKDCITTNYIDSKVSKRLIDYRVIQSYKNKKELIDNSVEITFYVSSANDRVRFGDLVGAQELLDYANEIAI